MGKRTNTKPDAPVPPANKPDGAKAFEIADDMENDHIGIDHLTDALHLIAERAAENDDPRMCGALHGIADGLVAFLERAEQKRCEIFHFTWGYAHGQVRGEPG